MFEFLMDSGNYEDRCVGRDDFDWGFVSTAAVSDGSNPFETAVCSSEYAAKDDLEDFSGMTIVESYSSREEAQNGHDKWVKTMTESPPDTLTDCCNAGVADLGSAFGLDFGEVRINKL